MVYCRAGLWAKNAIASAQRLEADLKANNTDKSVRWGRMMTKLRLWQLTEYERVIYLDADAFAMQVADRDRMKFSCPEIVRPAAQLGQPWIDFFGHAVGLPSNAALLWPFCLAEV